MITKLTLKLIEHDIDFLDETPRHPADIPLWVDGPPGMAFDATQAFLQRDDWRYLLPMKYVDIFLDGVNPPDP